MSIWCTKIIHYNRNERNSLYYQSFTSIHDDVVWKREYTILTLGWKWKNAKMSWKECKSRYESVSKRKLCSLKFLIYSQQTGAQEVNPILNSATVRIANGERLLHSTDPDLAWQYLTLLCKMQHWSHGWK